MSEKCPVCGSKLKNSRSKDFGRQYEYTCPKCGCFSLNEGLNNYLLGRESRLVDEYDLSKLKSSLFYYLRVIRHNFLEDKVTFFGFAESKTSNFDYVNVEHVYKLYPQTFSERLNMVMQLLHTEITDIGDRCYILNNWNELAYRFCLSNKDNTSTQAEEMWNILSHFQYIDGQQTGFTFSAKGWEKIDSLEQYKDSDDVFIAMSFDWKNQEYPLEECRDSIKEAVGKAGYHPIIISEEEHNHYIPEEIYNKIKQAKFVIVDLTTQNSGAYYEAGIAKGIGKDVIFTCNKKDFDNVHFDVEQINTIRWNSQDNGFNEFKQNLYRRIKYTAGDSVNSQPIKIK